MEFFEERAAENSAKISGNFSPHNLENIIMTVFGKDITFFPLKIKHIATIHEQSFLNFKDADILNTAAWFWRNFVLNIKVNKIPQNISVEHLKKGKTSLKIYLICFLQ